MTQNTAGPQPVIAAGNFRSEVNHFAVTVPPGWAATEGNEWLAKPFTGLVTFNSWNQTGFWAPEVRNGNEYTYSRETVGSQIPDGGAYVVLVEINGPPLSLGYTPPEYASSNLDTLWISHDARLDGGKFIGFFKWGKTYRIDIYCSANASNVVVEELNALLRSWRFDSFPTLDIAWAETQARQSLPNVTGNISLTKTEEHGGIAEFLFEYVWYTEGAFRRHYWQVDVIPTRVSIVWESGSPLP